MSYIYRTITPCIIESHKYYPVITITGPRQSGKSTLCRHLFPEYKYVNLERIATRALAVNDSESFLENLGDKVIIDEVQRVPDLLSEIQVRVDEDRSRRYILTGSSNFSLLNKVTQSLSGRTSLFTLLPFSVKELPENVRKENIDKLMWQGFYPGVIADDIPPVVFYDNYYNTYVERDLRDLLKVSNILKFNTFIHMLALRVGSEFNASALSREVGVSAVTISEWLSLLTASYITFELPPYFNNPNKSLTKSKKIYFYDTGLLCSLLSINDASALAVHPLRGAIFENMAVMAFMKKLVNEGKRPDLYFYRENHGLEVDIVRPASDGSIELYEIKSSKTLQPDYSANMKTLSASLKKPTQTTIIYNGESYPPAVLNVRDI